MAIFNKKIGLVLSDEDKEVLQQGLPKDWSKKIMENIINGPEEKKPKSFKSLFEAEDYYFEHLAKNNEDYKGLEYWLENVAIIED